MASGNSSVQQQQPPHFQQQQQQQINAFHCKECGRNLNSAESLDVHRQYHKENLMSKWATQATAATSHNDETNNNHPKSSIKREFIPNNTIAAAADSSDSMISKQSPEYSRATPEMILGHPPTPQSYQSASSPYKNHDNSPFSPGFQNYTQIKTERPPSPHYLNNYSNYNEPQFYGMDPSAQQNQNQQYSQEYMHKSTPYRYHPYQQAQHSPYDRSNSQVSSSSPAYPPQPTPSPSPKQCDKCGAVCDSASQLIEHINIAHPPTPAYHANQFLFNEQKSEEENQSEILDLDSHKVHQVYSEDEKPRPNGELNGHNPHSVSAMLNTWSPPQQKMFPQYMNGPEQKLFPQDPKLFQPHPLHGQEFMGNAVTTTQQEMPPQGYRPFEQIPAQAGNNAPVISSTQVPNNAPPTNGGGGGGSGGTKSANWKSNEARRPKTYNCTACNKWFTSSGHLKRHYNTTLHKNAVKSSGQPDPASLPISAHHHPARDNNTNKEDSTNSPGEEDTNSMPSQFERPNSMPGLLQQPPNGPYDRQPNLHHHTPPLHSPIMNAANNSLTNLSNGSSPNGEAGLSPTTSLDSRGLLSSLSTPPSISTSHGYNMAPPPPPPHMMMQIENQQFQMYPNGSAPHVTQVTATNNLSIIGEFHQLEAVNLIQPQQQQQQQSQQPLPSFEQFQAHRYGIIMSYGNANVGGGGPATAPYSYYPDYENEARTLMYRTDDDEYRLTVLTVADPAPMQEEEMIEPCTPLNNNNNNNTVDDSIYMAQDAKLAALSAPPSPEKAHIKRDYEESTGSPLITSTVQANSTSTKTGIHKCIDCDKLFNKACYLTQHNKTFHCGDKPFKCGRCGKRFSSDNTYQEHLTKHAGEKPHKCDLCPKQFNHKTDLRRHMCLHTGQKPYSCDTCGKGFIRKDHMLKHCETHFRKTHNKMVRST